MLCLGPKFEGVLCKTGQAFILILFYLYARHSTNTILLSPPKICFEAEISITGIQMGINGVPKITWQQGRADPGLVTPILPPQQYNLLRVDQNLMLW